MSADQVLFDREATLMRVDHDLELLDELVALLRPEAARLIGEVREAAIRSDPAGLEESAHALKSSLGNLGAARAASIARELEELGRAGLPDGLELHLEQLEHAVAGFLREYEEFRARAPAPEGG